MEKTLNLGKILSKEEQKKLAGGDDPCYTMQGTYGLCKTSALCLLDLPICEPV